MKRILLIALLLPQITFGFLVAQLNLEQLTHLAETIFVGRCLEVREGRDQNNRPVQYVRFQVTETLKGEPQPELTFKQILMTSNSSFSELSNYQVGEEVVLFLSKPSEWGLTAPVGLSQGKFLIQSQGRSKTVVNGTRNRGLMIGMSQSSRVKSLSLTSSEKRLLQGKPEIPYQEFVSLVRKLIP